VVVAEFRVEHDSMGDVRVPADALWRAQTQRAVENFPLSGMPIDRQLISALGSIKAAAAEVNSASHHSTVGRTIRIWIKRADCCGQSNRNTAAKFLGPIS